MKDVKLDPEVLKKEALCILQDTRGKLADEKNWCQERIHEPGYRSIGNVTTRQLSLDRYCILGALGYEDDESAYLDETGTEPQIEARERIQDQINMYIPVWNDVPGRQHTEVVGAIDSAISKLEDEINGTPET